MVKKDLNEHEQKIVWECLKASAYGPFFIDKKAQDPFWEISAIFGLSINELREIADKWPNVEMGSEKVKLAVNNSMNNLLGYPNASKNEIWSQYISVPPEQVSKILKKWESMVR